MPETPALTVAGLKHRFGDVVTLDDVSLTVAAGEIVTVLGPSGSGKTTLLRSIAGFADPVAGRVEIGGVTVHEDGRPRVPAERRRVGMVFQDYALFPHLSVADNVAFGVHRAPDRDSRVRELLELTGLAALGARKPAALSGGQQQRVALARALAPRPALLLLDEPFANLDADRRASLIGELRRLLEAERASALLVTHDRVEALAMSDRVAVLGLGPAGGRLLQCDAPERVYRRPVDEQAARITGEVQLLDGHGHGPHAETSLGRVPLLEPRQGPVRLLLRPGTLRWADAAGGIATVSSRQFGGRGYRLWCRTPAGELCLECEQQTAPGIGAQGAVVIAGPCWAVPR